MSSHSFTNSLINESSPYLLQHAHNPVHWLPWGKEAFEKARKEKKLVLVSIGYSACHWCHVMEKECFEDPGVAKIMNEHYVCVKVDREEHPEVDQAYMDAVQVISGRGGWPLNCFALPDGKPVYGGTYFPKQDWESLLVNLNKLFRNEPEKVKDLCDEIDKGIISIQLLPDKKEVDFTESFAHLEKFTSKISAIFDKNFGGYNYAPKFPMPNNFEYLLYYSYALKNMNRNGEANLIENHVYLTLDKMAMGGINDQVGGGFARYSVDSFWKVPHFEKMLYDNAQLMSLYSHAYKQNPSDLYKEVIHGIHTFISGKMTSPEGGFYCALDADSNGKEGEFYVWKKEELEELLWEDFPLFSEYYGMNDKEIWEENTYILQRKWKDAEFCKAKAISPLELNFKKTSWINKLNERRNKRLSPALDDKILTPWNALMLTGYIDAYKATKEHLFLEAGLKNGRFIRNKLFTEDGGLMHCFNGETAFIPAFLDSYAFVSSAFIALYEVTFDEEWLNYAKSLADYAIEHHFDITKNMFYYTSEIDEILTHRKTEVVDNVIPSSNSEMAKVLFALSHYYGDDTYQTISKNMLAVVYDAMIAYPQGYTNWGILLLHNLLHFYEVAVTGKLAPAFRDRMCKEYLPNMVVMGGIHSSELDLLRDKFAQDRTLIFVCENKTCLAPISSTGEAVNVIKKIV